MRHQLQHLLQVASQPRVTIQVLPLALGAHTGLRGPFVLLEFRSVNDPDVLYLENRLGGDRTRTRAVRASGHEYARSHPASKAADRWDMTQWPSSLACTTSWTGVSRRCSFQ
jgi:hypothetical protein